MTSGIILRPFARFEVSTLVHSRVTHLAPPACLSPPIYTRIWFEGICVSTTCRPCHSGCSMLSTRCGSCKRHTTIHPMSCGCSGFQCGVALNGRRVLPAAPVFSSSCCVGRPSSMRCNAVRTCCLITGSLTCGVPFFRQSP